MKNNCIIAFHFTYKDKKGTYSIDNIEKTKQAIFRAFMNAILVLSSTHLSYFNCLGVV